MDREIVLKLRSRFEAIVRKHVETGTEFWCARDLQTLLGYARWENFAKVIEKAVNSCRNAGYEPQNHFLEVTKMVDLGSVSNLCCKSPPTPEVIRAEREIRCVFPEYIPNA